MKLLSVKRLLAVFGLLLVLAGVSAVSAQEGTTYTVLAGGFGPANIEALAFSPNTLQVHRGDTVVWQIGGFHNVRLGEAPLEFIIAPTVDGQPLPQFNQEVVLPSVENGGSYTGGEAGSGLFLDPSMPPVFALIIDAEPGTYVYYCDIHPGMVGIIEVVPDDVEIPTPQEVATAQAVELSRQINAGAGAMQETMADHMGMDMGSSDEPVEVQAGASAERAAVQAFFPGVVVIEAGQSVTWNVPPDSIEVHTVTWPNYTPADVFDVQEQEAGPPIFAFGPAVLPTDNTEIAEGDSFNSSFIAPGQSYTLTFTEPGMYVYVCTLHPGMMGTVVVMAEM
ncbi:MAG: hypothetical protein H7175_04665 [Burkholderiales bacterium]|nr:hypothetical protein [Anaerolineae bacterium]